MEYLDGIDYNFDYAPVSRPVTKAVSKYTPKGLVGDGAIRRHFMNFTGVQYGVKNSVQLLGDFKLSFKFLVGGPTQGLITFCTDNTDEYFRLSSYDDSGSTVIKLESPGQTRDCVVMLPVALVRIPRYTVYVFPKTTGLPCVTEYSNCPSIQILKSAHNIPVPGLGDIRIDDPNSIYQRDYSQQAGAQLVSNGYFDSGIDGWASSSEYGATPSHFNSSMKVTSNGNYGRVVTAIETVPGSEYVLSVDILSLTDRSLINITNFADGRGGGDEIVLITPNATGNYQLQFTATNTTTYIALGSSVTGYNDVYVFDNVVVKEFHGIELKNTVIPGDFEQFEHRAGWGHWVNEFWPQLLSYSVDFTRWGPLGCSSSYDGSVSVLTVTNASNPYLELNTTDTSKYDTTEYSFYVDVTAPAGRTISVGLLRDGYSDFDFEYFPATGGRQTIRIDRIFNQIPGSVRCRFSLANSEQGGQVGDVYTVHGSCLILSSESETSIETSGIGGNKISYADGADS